MTYEPMPCHVLLFLNIPPTRWPPAWSQKQFFKALPPHPTISCSHKMIYNSGEVMSTDNSFQTIPHDVMLLQPSQHRRHTSRQQTHKKSFLAVSHNEWTYCCVKRILWIYKNLSHWIFPEIKRRTLRNPADCLIGMFHIPRSVSGQACDGSASWSLSPRMQSPQSDCL